MVEGRAGSRSRTTLAASPRRRSRAGRRARRCVRSSEPRATGARPRNFAGAGRAANDERFGRRRSDDVWGAKSTTRSHTSRAPALPHWLAATMSEETPDYDKSKVVRAIEGGDLDDLRDAVEGVPEDERPGVVNAEDSGTWHTPLHHCAKRNAVDAAKLLLELGANPNAEDIKGRTCLHVACDAYREDETGDIALEDMIVALVDGGALSLECVQGKLPDPGDDAAGIVQKYLDRAFEAGAETRKNQKEARRAKRKEKMDAIFAGKLAAHVANASACAITVMDSGDDDGYKFGSRDGNR